jgi:negative regulator of sigma E activity
MNELQPNSYSEMLNLLVDGELDSSHESGVFSELSHSEDLRIEFRELMSIRDSIRMDTEAFTPPLNVASSLFDKLGFSQEALLPAGGSALSTANISRTATIFRKFWLPVATAVLSSLLTYFIMQNNDKNTNVNQNSYPVTASKEIEKSSPANSGTIKNANPANETQKQTNDKQSNTIVHEKSISNNSISTNKVIETGIASKHSKKNVTENNDNTGSTTEDITRLASLERPAALFSPSVILQPKFNLNTGNSSVQSFEDSRIDLSRILTEKEHNGMKYAIILRGITGASFPQTDVPTNSSSILSNLALGAYVIIDEHNRIGIEIGREPFSQIFTNMENGRLVRYEQNPMLFWAGLSYRYNLDRVGSIANGEPFIQLIAGSSESGLLSKGLMGMQFRTDNGLGFFLGLEGSLLFFENQKSYFTTKKIGLTYSMFFDF